MATIRTVHDLEVYRLSFEAAMDVFELSKRFPPEETRTWLDFALACKYCLESEHKRISGKYDRICAMLYRLIEQWT